MNVNFNLERFIFTPYYPLTDQVIFELICKNKNFIKAFHINQRKLLLKAKAPLILKHQKFYIVLCFYQSIYKKL